MNEQAPQPSRSQDAFARARELAAELGHAGDPVVEYPKAMPTRPDRSASGSERNAYKNTESGLVKGAAERYNDDLEGAMVMRDLTPFLRAQSAMDQPGVSYEEKLQKVAGLTKYQYLLAHFILDRGDDEAYMRRFWQSAETLAQKDGKDRKEIIRLKVGVLSTVATIKAMTALGYEPQLAHPDEDAYDAIDVWNGSRQALQIKGAGDQLEVYRTDEAEFPAVRLNQDGRPTRLISTGSADRLNNDLYKFATKVDAVSEREGHPVEGLFIRIPYSRINHATGEPSAQLVEELRYWLHQPELEAAT